MSTPTPESLQPLILNALDQSSTGTIDDSRQLIGPNGQPVGPGEVQIVVKGVLDSLASREVSLVAFSFCVKAQQPRQGGVT